ncbi:MAG: glycosyltransferase [bacterium]|nr:glycosyltransferase [bacterium]
MKNLVARNPNEKESQQRIEDEILLTKNANHIISSSINDKEYLTHLYSCPENKITAINPGVDTDLFKPIDKNTALQFIHSVTHNKIVTFVGRIEALKGIDVLMYAIKIIHDRNPDLKVALLIVGGYSNRINNKELIRLKKLQNTLKMSPIVGFIDQRPQQELPYYYNASELVVTPSHYESFGMTSLEAMACGTPVLITDTSGISSMLNDDFKDLLISANNPLLLASHIEEILKNDSYKKQFKLKILKNINKFSWKNVAIKTDEVYQSIINKTS